MRIGILGGGQLGRMLAQAGASHGHEFRFLDPSPDACAAAFGELITGDYRDPGVLARFASGLDAATYEFENVDLHAARFLAERVPLSPPVRALESSQDRLEEKRFLQGLGIAVAPFRPVTTREDWDRAIAALGLPIVLKTRRLGYDGKGQEFVRHPNEVGPAFERLGGAPLIAEDALEFERELSVLAVRGRDGSVQVWPLFENVHRAGILRLSLSPAEVSPGTAQQAEEIARRILGELDYVGVLAVELFDAPGGLVANEIAPRVHNSGHGTMDGNQTSQFENHVRAVAGMPFGKADPIGPPDAPACTAMVNLIGEIPHQKALAPLEGVSVHLYGKAPRPGRKVGHLNIVRPSREELKGALAQVRGLPGVELPG